MIKIILREIAKIGFLSTALFFNTSFFRIEFINLILFTIYLFVVSKIVATTFQKVFFIQTPFWITRIFSSFLIITFLGYFSVFPIIFFKISTFTICSMFFLVGILFSILKNIIIKNTSLVLVENKLTQRGGVFKMVNIWKYGLVGVYILLVILSFCLLFISRTGKGFSNPWEVINPYYLIVFLGATFILGIVLFLNIKLKILLLLLITHSLLLHSYLPLVHKLIYGPDGWRHMANEVSIIEDRGIVEVKTIDAQKTKFQGLNLGNLSYSHLWGIKIIGVKILGFELVNLTAWLIPVVWAIMLPLLLFGIGNSVFLKRTQALFFTWLGFLPFTWQFSGSMTLPNNWGFLMWLLFIFLLLKRLENPSKKQFIVLSILFLSSFFGYSLYFIVISISFALGEILIYFKKKQKNFFELRFLYSYILIGAVVSSLFIPVLELISGYSFLSLNVPWFSQIKQFIGNFLSVYVGFGPRPHYILTGNIIFNQPPAYHFVETFVLKYRIWLCGFMVVFFVLSLMGLINFFKKKSLSAIWLSLLTITFLGNYLIGRYIFVGEQILSRRLDNVLAFFLIICFANGLFFLFERFLFSRKKSIIIGVIGICFISLAICAAYSLGPANESVSENDYSAMQYVWQQEKNKSENAHCIIANVYPLLALEQISGKKIIGGGFPITQYFAQKEREELYKEFLKNPSEELWKQALDLVKTNQCWLVIKRSDFVTNDFVIKNQQNTISFGDMIVWKYTKEVKSP